MTPAIKLLQQRHIAHTIHTYDHEHGATSYGLEAVQKLGVEAGKVFKTLVVITPDSRFAVGIVPVQHQLSLKRFAAHINAKKVVMASADDVTRCTGYVLGGVSPLAQKQRLITVLDQSAMMLDSIFVSAGQRGLEIELAPTDLVSLTGATLAMIGTDS